MTTENTAAKMSMQALAKIWLAADERHTECVGAEDATDAGSPEREVAEAASLAASNYKDKIALKILTYECASIADVIIKVRLVELRDGFAIPPGTQFSIARDLERTAGLPTPPEKGDDRNHLIYGFTMV